MALTGCVGPILTLSCVPDIPAFTSLPRAASGSVGTGPVGAVCGAVELIQQPAMAWSCQAGKADSATAFLPTPLCCELCHVPRPQGCSLHDVERGSGCQGKCLPVLGARVEELPPAWLYLTLSWWEWDQYRRVALGMAQPL